MGRFPTGSGARRQRETKEHSQRRGKPEHRQRMRAPLTNATPRIDALGYGPAMTDEDELRALGRASAELSHELRNVLATIGTSAHAASRNPAEAARFLARIVRHAELGQRLVEDVMALAKPLGTLALERQDSVAVLAAARSTLQGQAHFDDRLEAATLEVHPILFPRLLHALYANAIAVSRAAEGPCIVTKVHAAEGALHVDVEDDGPGIPEALRPRLFDAFATGREGGVGLGLALAQRIAEAHGGRLTLRDDTTSTTFRIALPSR